MPVSEEFLKMYAKLAAAEPKSDADRVREEPIPAHLRRSLDAAVEDPEAHAAAQRRVVAPVEPPAPVVPTRPVKVARPVRGV